MATVVVLAGGMSKRMGRDKLELTLGGQTLLESIVCRFRESFEDVVISVSDPDKYSCVSGPRVIDILPGAGPLSGLHAALTLIPYGGVFLVAADLPYACPRAAKRIIELCGDKDACIIRHSGTKLEPLFGYYKKSLLRPCEEAITSGDYRMSAILADAGTRYVTPYELGELWDEKLILNINYPEDYEKARNIL